MDSVSFLMNIQDSFGLKGRGVVVAGTIEQGACRKGDILELVGFLEAPKQVEVLGFEMIGFTITDDNLAAMLKSKNAGLLISGISLEEVVRGQVLATPGTISQQRRFKASIKFTSGIDDIRQQARFGLYRQSIHIRHADVYATFHISMSKQDTEDSETVEAEIEVSSPIPVEIGTLFEIGRSVGIGTIISIDSK